MIEAGCRWLLMAGAMIERRLSTVLFHRVLSAPDPLRRDEPDAAQFSEQVRWLATNFTVLPLHEAASLLYRGKLPPRALSITFDDGYRDNYQNALPVLLAHGVQATFFVTTAYTSGGMMWNDRVIEAMRAWRSEVVDLTGFDLGMHNLASGRLNVINELLRRLKHRAFAEREAIAEELLASTKGTAERMMMSEEEIKSMHAAGMEIGGHTHRHPILKVMPDDVALAEIASNKQQLEDITGRPLLSFAYPNGRPLEDFDGRHVAMAGRCGYRYAVTTARGTARRTTSALQIPRFTPWDRTRRRYLGRLVGNYFHNAMTVPELAH